MRVQLYLQDNALLHPTEGISRLTELKELWLSGNQLEYLPEAFAHLSKLQELWMDGVPLSSIPGSDQLPFDCLPLPFVTELSLQRRYTTPTRSQRPKPSRICLRTCTSSRKAAKTFRRSKSWWWAKVRTHMLVSWTNINMNINRQRRQNNAR